MVPRRQCLSGTEQSWSGPGATSLPDGGIRTEQTAIHAAASRSLRNSLRRLGSGFFAFGTDSLDGDFLPLCQEGGFFSTVTYPEQ
ncbi:hypothetical protein INR49_025654 [Caranx melampygus]|nr:hypothetical protein INR49_025654 [Caranx melampygus]